MSGRVTAGGWKRIASGDDCTRILAASAREWDAHGCDSADLYRGSRLTGALDWSAQIPGELSPLEREFVDRSRGDAERQQRRLRTLLAGVAVLLVDLGARRDLCAGQAATALRNRHGSRSHASSARRRSASRGSTWRCCSLARRQPRYRPPDGRDATDPRCCAAPPPSVPSRCRSGCGPADSRSAPTAGRSRLGEQRLPLQLCPATRTRSVPRDPASMVT